jgi:mRNA interferase MazF
MEYIPDKSDIVWITLNPQAGHEHAGRRPALILSPKSYNEKVGLALLCPVTSRIKGYPFEVKMPQDKWRYFIRSNQEFRLESTKC